MSSSQVMKHSDQTVGSASKGIAAGDKLEDGRGSRRSCYRRLVAACKHKDLATIKTTLSERPELANQKDRHNRTLLHFAAILLLEDQLSRDEENLQQSQSDESSAGRRQVQLDNCIECFNYLADRCDLRLWWEQDLDGLSTLHLAVISSNLPLVEHIIYAHPYSIKYPLVCTLDNERHSPLHWAVITNNLECVKSLINFAGTKLAHEPDLNGATPLHYATQTSDYARYRQQLGRMLRDVGGCDPKSSADDHDDDNLSGAAPPPAGELCSKPKRSRAGEEAKVASQQQRRSLEILQYLVRLPQINLECADKDRRTPLLWAASSGNRDALALLLASGADATSCDSNKLGALHCAASHGYTDCLETLMSVHNSRQVNVNQTDNLSCTPLFYSVLSGNVDCVDTLLDRGADADWQDSKGRTAAHFAALRGQLAALKLLGARGANLWLANKQGDLPLHYAVKSGRVQVIRWLLEHSPYERAVNAINNYGRAPIHLAVMKANTQLAEYLISQGANLNQLVKSKKGKRPAGDVAPSKRQPPCYHYETALDMAQALGQSECVKLLAAQKALTAEQVLGHRNSLGGANAKSLFDVQASDEVSPIGFETSCSSATPIKQNGAVVTQQQATGSLVPKLAGPKRTDGLQSQTDSSNSSGSPPAVDAPQSPPRANDRWQRQTSTPPYKGGISYNNQHICASIKCKLYGDSMDNECDGQPSHRARTWSQSAPVKCSPARQEIITNVNVYTSPTATRSCQHQNRRTRQQPVADVERQSEDGDANSESTLVDDGEYASEGREDADGGLPSFGTSELLPHLANATPVANLENEMPLGPVYATSGRPPARASLGQLPVILSEHEHEQDSTTSGSPYGVRPDERQQVEDSGHVVRGDDCASHESESPLRRASPAWEEPRFDRSDRAVECRASRATSRPPWVSRPIRSPVADYIRRSGNQRATAVRPMKRSNGPEARSVSQHDIHSGRSSSIGSTRRPLRPLDLDAIQPKVDTGRPSRAKSMSKLSNTYHQQAGDGQQRSVSRQTIIRTRRLSVDSVELAARVERSIRKYKQESKLFEELQRLKRSQIRSGRANEALLVKRLVEHLQRDLRDLIGLDSYSGPYTYMAYERFLYDQLRKLSLSNCAKLSRHRHQEKPQQQAPNNYLDDADLSADMELMRIMRDHENNTSNANGSDLEDSCSVELEPSGALEEIRVKTSGHDEVGAAHEDDTTEIAEGDDRRQSLSAGSERRRGSKDSSSAEARDNQDSTALGVAATDAVEETACSLSSAIMVDALGNLSRVGSPTRSLHEEEHEDSVTSRADGTSKQTADEATSEQEEDGLIDVATQKSHESTSENQQQPTRGEMDQIGTGEGQNNEDQQQQRGRRRSVINIGNRMELVVHDVGIEIDPAPDDENESDGENAKIRAAREAVIRNTSREQQPDDEREQPEIDEHQAEKTGVECEEAAQDVDTREACVDHGRELFAETAHELGEEGGDSYDCNAIGESVKSLEFSKPNRRASSPPAYGRLTESQLSAQQVAEDRHPKSKAGRSCSVVDRDTQEKQRGQPQLQQQKRVFNGHDLDEMRSSRRSSMSVGEKISGDNVADDAGEHVEATSGENAATEKHQALGGRKCERKKKRSHLPKGRFQVRVPTEEIKQRWSTIRATEQQRRGLSGARSQPADLDSSGKDLAREASADCRFRSGHYYTLLYEINLNNRGTGLECQTAAAAAAGDELQVSVDAGDNGRRQARGPSATSGRGGHWCQRRAVNIVDLRAIKRTLSLPDALIYSNDLLKRFSILKL